MRKFLTALILLLGTGFLVSHYAEVEAILNTIQRGDMRFLAMAIVVQAAWLLNVAASFRAIYRLLGVEEDIKVLFLVAAAASFVNVVTTSGGVGGVTIFISEAKKRGYSAAKATLASVLFVLFDYVGFIAVLTLGLVVLLRRNNLSFTELAASAIVVIIAIALAFLLLLGMRSAEELGKALAWMARQVNHILHPFIKHDYLSEERGYEYAREAAEGLHEIRKNPKELILPAALALSNKAFLLSVFFLMFMAFRVPFSTGTLIAGFSIGYLFTIVSPTPAGIGIVEGALTISLRSLHVPLGSAAVITLAYRGFTFWLPLLFGMIALRAIGKEYNSSKS